ncbi:MAG: radical SAM protein [Firmicutes bacterium]|nr:radical SAM protein [Bacillota bacterium]
MKLGHFFSLSWFGIKTILFKQKKPILGTIILTDHCNLSCKHCAVNNINNEIYSYESIVKEMKSFYKEGIRILFFCGGETLLWEDDGKDIKDLIKKAREIGFYIVNVVTNGTITLDIKEADIIFLSLDGLKDTHNLIRGDTYDTIMKNLNEANNSNICVYLAVNKLNYKEIEKVGKLSKNHPNINSISFNLHTPYKGTEYLALTKSEKREVIGKIKKMIKDNIPVFNLNSTLDNYLKNNWKRPCNQCIVSEDNKRYVCGRCVEEEGLCEECGYLFAVEFSLLFNGNIKVILDVLKTYLKYI